MKKIKESISVVVPVYNEEDTLKKAVDSLDKFLKDNFKKYEIIVVESGSTDRTPYIADKLKRKNIRVIHQRNREGYGSGLRLGYRFVKNDLVWYYSGDMPFSIKHLLKAVKLIKNADVVMAYRTGKRENLTRIIATKGYNLLIRTLFRVKAKDVNYSFKLIRLEMVKKLDLKSNGWFIDGELQAELKRNNARIRQIPVPYIMRKGGESKVKISSDVPNMLKEMMIYLFRKKRKNN